MQTGANMDPNADPNELMQQTTRGLMAAVSRLPQLTDRKRTLDKHTNLLHHLLQVLMMPMQPEEWLTLVEVRHA